MLNSAGSKSMCAMVHGAFDDLICVGGSVRDLLRAAVLDGLPYDVFRIYLEQLPGCRDVEAQLLIMIVRVDGRDVVQGVCPRDDGIAITAKNVMDVSQWRGAVDNQVLGDILQTILEVCCLLSSKADLVLLAKEGLGFAGQFPDGGHQPVGDGRRAVGQMVDRSGV